MICALAVRLKVVASLKVTPSVEFAAVCSTSLRKMSSFSLSAVACLLRVTVALPVRVATLPIGSSLPGDAVAVAPGAAGVGGVGADGACAIIIALVVASEAAGGRVASSSGDCAETLDAPASIKQLTSQIAIENRRRVTGGPEQGRMNTRLRLRARPAEPRMNACGLVIVRGSNDQAPRPA